MARRSQCSSAGDNPLDPNYLPPHYREEYRLAIDALVEEDLEGYFQFLEKADVVNFLSKSEIQYIQEFIHTPEQSHRPEHLEQRFLESGGDGSSDTYWPIHSDLEVPGLDLGWPQMHHFVGPTEVTTLVNPPETDMPSIKDQARRLIKNAQQVIAVVMDMFTDVDMFADILNAAMRNVAVYILLDEQNAHHFVNMVSNCRVNLHSIQFLRVRTVSGITYHCRSGKSFKGQMMDRFLLTDCRAVLSGNYSFMWSYEKLHRSMAHLFLGQLVSTFDEEFRILFAQSQPLMLENLLIQMDEFNLPQKRQYQSDKGSLYRDSRKLLDSGHPEEWRRHSFDERMDVDWRMMPLKKQESLHGPSDMYSRLPPQQQHMDPLFDQGPTRVPMMENPAFKRHSYGEGGHGRFSYPFQQGLPEPDNQRRQVPRVQPFYPGPGPGPQAEYSGSEKFWNQDYHSADPYIEPQDMQPPQNFDPVLNYLSSTRNVDFETNSDKLQPAADLPFNSSNPNRLSLGQPYACQTSPTHSNPPDQRQFFPEANVDRKDPRVKRGLRNWRLTSYLSAHDNPEEEGLFPPPPQAPEPVEEPTYPIQQTAPAIDLSLPKIPNVREFKVPALPRASQIPSYAKITGREQLKNLPDESTVETKTTPMPSESSFAAEGEKAEEAEQKGPNTSVLKRDDSFRRKYNPAVPRSSRLRSSLIFSSLEQQNSPETKTSPGQQNEESDKNEEETKKISFVSKVMGKRRSASKEPIEWSRYKKPDASDNLAPETLKPDDKNCKSGDKDPTNENEKDILEKGDVQEAPKPADIEQTNFSTSVLQSNPNEVQPPKMNQPPAPTSLFSTPAYVDMNDPDMRLMFFKELAAKRKAAKAAEAKKIDEKCPVKPSTDLKVNSSGKVKEPGQEETSGQIAESKNAEAERIKDKDLMKPLADLENKPTVKIEQPETKEASETMAKPLSCDSLVDINAPEVVAAKTASSHECESISDKNNSFIKYEQNTSPSSERKETRGPTESENMGSDHTQSAAVFVGESSSAKPPEEPMLLNPTVKESSPSHSPTHTNVTAANLPSHVQGTDKSESLSPDSTSKNFTSLTTSSVEAAPSSTSVPLDSKSKSPVSVQSGSIIFSTPLPPEPTRLEFTYSNPSVLQGSLSDHILPDSSSVISPSLPTSSFISPTTLAETLLSNDSNKDSSSTLSSVILPSSSHSTEARESERLQEPLKPDKEDSQKSTESELKPVNLNAVCSLTLSDTTSLAQTTHVESDIYKDKHTDGFEVDTSSLQSTTKTNSEESCIAPSSEKDVNASENSSNEKPVSEQPRVLGSSEDIDTDTLPPNLISSVPEPILFDVSDVEQSNSKPDQNETIDPALGQPDQQTEHSPSQALSNTDMDPNASQSESTASTQDAPTQVTPPSELKLTELDTPAHTETVSCSSLPAESEGPVLSPESENTEINISVVHSTSDANSLMNQISTDSNKTELLSSKTPTEPDVLPKTPESTIPESHTSELPAENSSIENQGEVSKETESPDPCEKQAEDIEATTKVNEITIQESSSSDKNNDPTVQNNCSEPVADITSESKEAVPVAPQSKQTKSSQTRYQSSTANVISSSNLRDDTKLLLGQISANSQSRNEVTKESPVTDDEKEDEADKNTKREKERANKQPGRGQPKSPQEREKVLERIQSMRKERRVYSRFEV